MSRSMFLKISILPTLLVCYVLVAGFTGFCPTCNSIVSSVFGSTPASFEDSSDVTPASIETTGVMHDISLPDLDGRQVSLGEFAGRPMIIEVWATWCGPCRKLRKIIKDNIDGLKKEVVLVAVSVDQKGPSVVKQYLARSPGSDDMIELMVTQQFRDIIKPFNSRNTIPKIVYVNSNGDIIEVATGVPNPSFLLAMAKNLP
ncbi:MAG: hypothetical protein CMJ32_04830 [Phycisphaerae bacterium]|nr:hypothetical protein [Phycisphaerae bacterium]